MFEINRETILTTEKHAKFLRYPCKTIWGGIDADEKTIDNIVKLAMKARDFVADPKNNALGLASRQVGSKYAWFVMNCEDKTTKIILQPQILARFGRKQHIESCFSEPGVEESVKRAKTITVRYFFIVEDDDGWFIDYIHSENLTGRDAQVFQHEYDHLNGILIVDKNKKSSNKKRKGWF